MSAILRLFSKKATSAQDATVKHVSSNPQKAALEAKIKEHESVLKNLTKKVTENGALMKKFMECQCPDPSKMKRGMQMLTNEKANLVNLIINCNENLAVLEKQLAEGNFSHSVFEATE